MTLSLTLRHRLPKVAALYADGKVSYRVISAIAWHTDLVTDGEPVAQIDAALANQAAKWGRLSDYELAQAIDVWVDLHDPGALRRTRNRASASAAEGSVVPVTRPRRGIGIGLGVGVGRLVPSA